MEDINMLDHSDLKFCCHKFFAHSDFDSVLVLQKIVLEPFY